jgi:uncharacterized protein (TIGR03118 family)
MKNISKLRLEFLRRHAFTFVSACVLIWPAASFAQHYVQTNLVAGGNRTGVPADVPNDPNLVDPWGIARGTTSPWWVADRATGVSTLYNGAGTILSLVVTIPNGSPTGIVFNGSSDFAVGPNQPAVFLFVSLTGTISGWNPGLNPNTMAVQKVPASSQSVFTGATIAQIGGDRYLYVADIRQGRIAVYDTNFNPVELGRGAFDDDFLPRGFVPFNVQNIGNNLYVAFAQQNQAKNFVVFGAGLGMVDVFSPGGRLLMRLQYGPWFNAPWGLALAPTDFGSFSHRLIVGQFGSGEILAFDAVTGRFEGKLLDQNNNVIVLPGLWAIAFGAGQPAQTSGPANALYFNAGINQGTGGLFGNLTPVSTDLTQGNDQ